ncbi:hypothetical protein CONLIGDRAFT_691242 [Coniochaeta ligniaria NRRL 30616]|uniref:Uncharacterized protein n=1 Tax=Coniochaeta ligniaria NRRL 30616 TaxID=1408157 RepID=A0A1J7J695_9PEZI|nr:hypothetical protein CONLIGDRAFT_691242 [Coniochaeta ligniaria NRRL 30616]
MEPNTIMYPMLPNSPADLVPLPTCEGPKLQPFDFGGEEQEIEFIDRLDWRDALEEDCFTMVFVVKIRGEIYALKVFRFLDENWLYQYVPEEVIPAAVQYDYFDFFNRECRAYGRLKEANREDLAAKCHGYILLTEKMEQRLLAFADLPANSGNEEYYIEFWGRGEGPEYLARKESANFLPVRAILKDLLPGSCGITIPEAPRIFRDIVELQRLGILLADVAERQWVAGQLIDFDRSITTPHVLLTPKMFGYDLTPYLRSKMQCSPEELVMALARRDFEEFDEMAERWSTSYEARREGREGEVTFRCLPDRRRLGRLRPNSVRLYTYVDPREYDWKTHQSGKGRAVKTTRACRGQRKRVPKALIRVPQQVPKLDRNGSPVIWQLVKR